MGGNLEGLRNLIMFDCVAHSLSPVLCTCILNASLPLNVPLKSSPFSTGASTFFLIDPPHLLLYFYPADINN